MGRMSTAEVRDGLHDFAALMRADEKLAIPRGEPNLASTSAAGASSSSGCSA